MLNQTSDLAAHSIFRIIDANLNRLREGLRVIEDIYRYLYDNREISYRLKALRHSVKIAEYKELLKARDSKKDVLKQSTQSETKREDLQSILLANFKRTQESARTLEEILKLTNTKDSEHFKNIRYELYNLEKEILS